MLRHRWSVVVASALALSGAIGACDDHPRRTKAGSGSTAQPARPSASALRKVDWANVTLPGAVCAVKHPIHLHRRTAFLREIPRRWAQPLSYQREQRLRHGVRVDAAWEQVSYGRLGAGGPDAAGLAVSCSNGGGTADGVLAYAWVVFTGRERNLDVAGIVTPQGPQPPHELPTLVKIVFTHGGITAREYWYGHRDGTCCPSGRATTTWTYVAGRLRPRRALVTKRPS
jgi:hypothetical protein